jgi:threonine dehydrogenase-like Zn-dependent dehydrogenase
MKALVFTGPGTLELRDVEEPVVCAGEVLVHVRAAGICGSELHGARRPGFRKPPLIMGHEFAGVSAGGEAVVINPILSCGDCGPCRQGSRHICQNRQIIGVHRAGGFAERVAVPRSALRLMPPTLTWDTAAIAEPAANAVHAWARAGGAAGARAAVIGCGAIGLLCLMVGLAGGAVSVDVSDLSERRLAAAQRLGASSATLSGEYDVVIDAVGAAATRAQSVAYQRAGGVAVWLGLAEEDAGFDANALVRAEKRVLGSFAYSDEEFGHAMNLLAGRDLTWAVSYPLTAGAEIFTSLMNGALHPTKAVLRPGP